MDASRESDEGLQFQAVSEVRVDALLEELATRVRVVNEDALRHLIDQGVLARVAAAGCCKPDGGTCCPNKRSAFEVPMAPILGSRGTDVGSVQ
jgi:hypothetical protein